MAEWTMAEVLRLALRTELENYGEYRKHAEEMPTPALKKMFAWLASEEEKHINLIRAKMAEHKVSEK